MQYNQSTTTSYPYSLAIRSISHEPLGWTMSTNFSYLISCATIKNFSQCVRIRLSPWTIQLWLDDTCINGLCSAILHQTKKKKNMSWAFSRQLLFTNITRVLLALHRLHEGHHNEADHWHKKFQTQVHHTTNHHSSRHSCKGLPKYVTGKLKTNKHKGYSTTQCLHHHHKLTHLPLPAHTNIKECSS